MGGVKHAAVLGLALLALVGSARAELLQPATRGRVGKLPPMHLPFAGNGTCGEPSYDKASDTTSVQCLGPKHLLSAGQTINTMMLLENPYPKDKSVVVLNITSQMVDDNMRPVPLSELYVHHYGSPLILGSGAELRGSYTRKPLPPPYGLIYHGSDFAEPLSRMTNIQLINTVGLPAHQAKPCLECWCDHDPWHPQDITHSPVHSLADTQGPHKDRGDPTWNDTRPGTLAGSLFCCHQCPTNQPVSGPFGYHLQYTVTFRELKSNEDIKRVNFIGFDVMDGDFEYQLTEAMGPGTTHVQTLDTIFDGACPQKRPVDVVRCFGHQHFGGQCTELIDLDANKTICRTCPVFGTEQNVPGNEEGYVVKIPDDDLFETKPYTVAPGTRVRLLSKYDASIPRFGIMGLLSTFSAGMDGPCGIFRSSGGNGQAYTSNMNEEYHVPLYGMLGIPYKRSSRPGMQAA